MSGQETAHHPGPVATSPPDTSDTTSAPNTVGASGSTGASNTTGASGFTTAPDTTGATGAATAPALPDGERRPRSYVAVASALLLGLVVLLGGGFLFDRQFRPRVGIETPDAATGATATIAAPPTTTAPAAAAPTIAPPPRPTPWPRVGRTALEREVEEAYARYWMVLVQAYYTLDTSRLPEVMAGEELRRQEEQIRELGSQGRAGKLIVEHRISFPQVSDDRVVIYDEQLNRSLFLDAATRTEFRTSAAPETEKLTFEFRKIDGTWKVLDGEFL